MPGPIYFVGGSKGGVGKSLVSMATIDLLQQQGRRVLLVESDTGNPDVWKAYGSSVDSKLLDLDQADGWIDLVDACEAHPDHVVMVNSAARNSQAVTTYGSNLSHALAELKRQWVTLWVAGLHRDSLELLLSHMEAVPASLVHFIKNAYAGNDADYAFYNVSQVRLTVQTLGGRTVTFPELAKRVVENFYSGRLTIDHVAKNASIGNRVELMRWRSEVADVLGEIVHG